MVAPTSQSSTLLARHPIISESLAAIGTLGSVALISTPDSIPFLGAAFIGIVLTAPIATAGLIINNFVNTLRDHSTLSKVFSAAGFLTAAGGIAAMFYQAAQPGMFSDLAGMVLTIPAMAVSAALSTAAFYTRSRPETASPDNGNAIAALQTEIEGLKSQLANKEVEDLKKQVADLQTQLAKTASEQHPAPGV